jgi:DNA-binding transcriptional LysR family regulator
MSTAQQRQALLEGRIDLGIIIGTMSAPSVETRLLAEEPLVVAMAADHRLAGQERVSPRDILAEPLLLGHPRIAVRPLAGVPPLAVSAAWRRGPRLPLVRRFLAAFDAG